MNIIFVCTGNTCRSPMAEAIAKDIFEKNNIDSNVISRGLSVYAPSPASENARLAMEKMGLSLDGFVSTPLSLEDIEEADAIITMTKAHKEALEDICRRYGKELYTLGELAGTDEDVTDPFGGSEEHYEACADQLKEYIEKLAEKLV